MFIFLGLSVAFIIFTAIYLNKNKKGSTITKTKAEKVTSKRKTKNKLSDILNMKIKDNIIYSNNSFSYVMRLGSIDYHILSNKEQESIENILVETVLSIDYPVQFFTTTEYIDTSTIIENIKKNKPKNIQIKEYQNKLIEYLSYLMENRSISVIKNYVIITYYGNYEDAVESLNRNATAFKSSILRANISCELLTEDELYNLIYRELNKNSALNINHLREGGKNLYVGKKQKAKH